MSQMIMLALHPIITQVKGMLYSSAPIEELFGSWIGRRSANRSGQAGKDKDLALKLLSAVSHVYRPSQ
jgi:hypothetical protein